MRTLLLTLTTCLLVLPVQAKYSGGSGTAQDPYQIATAADLIAFGETPADYDKHFILTADIDLDPKLPGRKVFDKAVIASAPNWTTPFSGVFDGKGRAISHLTMNQKDVGSGKVTYLGLFGLLASGAQIRNVGVVDASVTGSSGCVGALVGYNSGTVIQCYSTGAVNSPGSVGGLVGFNGGTVTQCYSSGAVSGDIGVGGLVGSNGSTMYWGTVNHSYGTGAVRGNTRVGGLVGDNMGTVTQCYSIGMVAGGTEVGGLVGYRDLKDVVSHSVWDMETSGLSGSAGGVGLTRSQMMDLYMLGLNGFANDPNWVMDAGRDYPRLTWEGQPGQVIPEPRIDWLEGEGTAEKPYRINSADQLIRLHKASILWDKCFVLGADINLDPKLPGNEVFRQAVMSLFAGVFDGQGHTIAHLTIEGNSDLGLCGRLELGVEVRDLGVVDVNIAGSGSYVAGLVGYNDGGSVTRCYSTGSVHGAGDRSTVGGLVGYNRAGTVAQCYSTGAVSGYDSVGGLVGRNDGHVTDCYSTGAVSGTGQYSVVGGLVGLNYGDVAQCYSAGAVSGPGQYVGGLVGSGRQNVSGSFSFWDTQTSGQTTSAGGTGKTTAQMQDPDTFRAAGWGSVGPADGPHDIWAEPTGGGYPVLYWQLPGGFGLPHFSGGTGEPNDPYLVSAAQELYRIGDNRRLMQCHFKLVADLDMTGYHFYPIGDYDHPYSGVFDGNDHTISHLMTKGKDYVGLFGRLGKVGQVKNLGVVDINIASSGSYVAGLVGYNDGGSVTRCYSTGAVSGIGCVGGLVASNGGPVTQCYSTGAVSGYDSVGGLVAYNWGAVTQCYSTATVSASGGWSVGGLVAENYCEGCPAGVATNSFWDTQTSGQPTSAGGTGKTTAQMQTAKTFLDAGWDFVGETKNGTEDIWWILEGKDYPHLWWEAK